MDRPTYQITGERFLDGIVWTAKRLGPGRPTVLIATEMMPEMAQSCDDGGLPFGLEAVDYDGSAYLCELDLTDQLEESVLPGCR